MSGQKKLQEALVTPLEKARKTWPVPTRSVPLKSNVELKVTQPVQSTDSALSKSKRERGTGWLWLRGKIWWAVWYAHGRKWRESTKTTDEQKAKKFLHRRIGASLNGKVPESRSLRYESIRDSYMLACENKEHKSLRRDRDGNVYLESVKRLDEFFAGYKVTEINADAIERFKRDLKSEGYSHGSINRSLAALRRMFTLAMRGKKIQSAPFIEMFKEAKPRKGVLPLEKYNALLAALPVYLRLVVAIGFATGMRRGEILGLTWANIIWLDRIIRIEDSKNDEAREIPFTDELEGLLEAQFNARQPECDRVCFRFDRKGHAQPIGDFRKVWDRTCVKLGLAKWEEVKDKAGNLVMEPPRRDRKHSLARPKRGYNGLLFHDLRRSFVTAAEHAGAARGEVMKMSGHKTEAVYKRYAIENREARRQALAQIEKYRAANSTRTGAQFGAQSDENENGLPVMN